jgi:2-polyprenyl-3-methyl-5-hydroxy-6-metoxy-1,4-benzoquinol methylase
MTLLVHKLKTLARYLWQHGIEALSDRFYLFDTKAALRRQPVGRAITGAGSDAVEFHLIPTVESKAEFDIVRKKLGRMEHPEWTSEENSACLICGAPVTPAIEIAGQSESGSLKMGWCPACDYLQYSRRPHRQWFADWYKNSFDPAGNLEKNLETRPFTWRYYKRLLPFIGERKIKVLDFGAGYGEKTMAFRREGHELFCIEPSQARADYLRSEGCTVVCGALGDPSVEEFMKTHGPFDLVFTYHVIEHVAGGIDIFEQLASHVRPSGFFYLAIPELYKEGLLNNVFTLEHLNSFSRTAAKRFLNRLGFEVIKDADDIFQYYTNYCQYLVGRKTAGAAVEWEAANSDSEKFFRYMAQQLHLAEFAEDGGALRLGVYGHQPLDYAYTTEAVQRIKEAQGLPRIRFVHADNPLFWAS